MPPQRDLLSDLALGAAAGVAATWVMGQVSTALYAREDEEARAREDRARGHRPAYEVAAEKAGRAAGAELGAQQRERYGEAVHWGLGAGAGAVYGVLRSRTDWASLGFGTLYGTLFFLTVDEGGNTVLGLTPPPQEFPWRTHGRGWLAHAAFGAAAEAAMRVTDELRAD